VTSRLASLRPAIGKSFQSDEERELWREILAEERAQTSELRALAIEIRALRADLRRQAAAVPIADRFVQAVHGLLGNESFSAAQLLTLADSTLSTRLELRAVVEDIVRGDIHHPGAGRMFGRFLAKNSQHAVEALRVVPLGKTRDGFVYRIEVATKTRKAPTWADELTQGS